MKHLNEEDVSRISEIAYLMKSDKIDYKDVCEELKITDDQESKMETIKLVFANENL